MTIRIDPAARRAWHGNQMLSLGQREYDLLTHLAQHHGRAVPFSQLTRAIYGEPLNDRTQRKVQELAAALRRKLGDTPPYQYIVSVRGVGFRLPRRHVTAPTQRVEINGQAYDVVHWHRQADHGATAVFTLYARPTPGHRRPAPPRT
ncbi:winged helix-turn-helix domain-containing protein [Nonomuraea sp. NPDC004580]|uniref:winged helix-turn-helix domain-containing protein n=1 Tax=Nonomuraea sp. NPDC004580 TaxID=3154552 RepID=UPI0033BBE4D9